MYAPTRRITVARTIQELRAAVAEARAVGDSVGFVPTMGALHDGHASLLHAAAAEHDCVVVSIFVNPSQFNDPSDLVNYPRSEQQDFELAARAGATIAFAPSCDEVYPAGFAANVSPGPVAELLEGAHRPGHFDGVATVVTRLMNLVRADVAYFGRKDAQQLAVIEQVVRDLALETRVVGVETIREPDGLAMSSRNVRLTAEDRVRALAISRGLAAAQRLADGGERSARALEAAVLVELAADALEVDYATLVSAETFHPVDVLDGECVLAVAATVGAVRLIDNVRLPSVA